ncbi:MAG: hypothetical protein IT428_26285 [Planctomycetaceae bacterium]|nr:hypothetical protein [Planctomycetaceae bacterium]
MLQQQVILAALSTGDAIALGALIVTGMTAGAGLAYWMYRVVAELTALRTIGGSIERRLELQKEDHDKLEARVDVHDTRFADHEGRILLLEVHP